MRPGRPGLNREGRSGAWHAARSCIQLVPPSSQKIALQLKATLENVTNLRPVGEDFRWYLKDSVALKGGRGSASMVQKCKLCARENSIGRSGSA